jgi:hypothetical protein
MQNTYMATPFISYVPYQSTLSKMLPYEPVTKNMLPSELTASTASTASTAPTAPTALAHGLIRQYSVDETLRKHDDELEKELRELEPQYHQKLNDDSSSSNHDIK